jgi:hypothetical protein
VYSDTYSRLRPFGCCPHYRTLRRCRRFRWSTLRALPQGQEEMSGIVWYNQATQSSYSTSRSEKVCPNHESSAYVQGRIDKRLRRTHVAGQCQYLETAEYSLSLDVHYLSNPIKSIKPCRVRASDIEVVDLSAQKDRSSTCRHRRTGRRLVSIEGRVVDLSTYKDYLPVDLPW